MYPKMIKVSYLKTAVSKNKESWIVVVLEIGYTGILGGGV